MRKGNTKGKRQQKLKCGLKQAMVKFKKTTIKELKMFYLKIPKYSYFSRP